MRSGVATKIPDVSIQSHTHSIPVNIRQTKDTRKMNTDERTGVIDLTPYITKKPAYNTRMVSLIRRLFKAVPDAKTYSNRKRDTLIFAALINDKIVKDKVSHQVNLFDQRYCNE